MAEELQNHGFLPDEIQKEDYVFGARQIIESPLQYDGQWDDYVPEDELQRRNGLETSNCVAYGTLNCLETLYHRKYGKVKNFSERYVGVLAETTPQGNSPQKVIETIRKEFGLIPESQLPFSDDIDKWEEYYAPNPMRKRYIEQGQRFLREHDIKHEWVFKNDADLKSKQNMLIAALTVSPIGVSVFAWRQNNQALYYKKEGEQDNHWCMVYGYRHGEYWKVFDHYDDTHKLLDWNYDFGFAKRYFIEKKVPQTSGNWLQDFIARILSLLGIIKI